MPDSNIFEGPSILVREYIIQLIQRLQSFHHMTEYSVFPIQVVDIVGQCDEELTAASAVCAVNCWCYGHGYRALVRVLEPWYDLRDEVAGDALLRFRGDEGPYGLSPCPCSGGVSRLS